MTEAARRRSWVPPLAGVLCALTGVIDLLSAVSPADSVRLRHLTTYVPGALTRASAAATLVTGILLLLVARGLHHRKRRAWRIAVALLIGSIGLHFLKGLDVEEAVVAAAMLVGLLVWRDEFYAKGDPRTRWRALGAFLFLLAASYVLGLALLGFRNGTIEGGFQFVAASQHVMVGLAGIAGPVRFADDGAGRFAAALIADGLLALGLLTAVTTAYLVLRPAEPVARLNPDDEDRMRTLLARYGERDSLGYFSLRRDKSVIWSRSGNSCIAYRVVSGVMLASGDPLGDPGSWPDAIAAFLKEADAHAWTPAVMGCSEEAGTAWTRAGLRALEIGDEAVVEIAEFSLEGRAMRNVRQAVKRIERQGYSTEVARVRDLDPATHEVLRRSAIDWRGATTERGFSMALGRLGADDDDCLVVMARCNGAVRGFLHFVPWGATGFSLDLMRRDREADNGLNELLIVAALHSAPALGIERISLNFAVFRAALERGERLGAGPVSRAWRGLLMFVSRWFQIDSLYRFNAKFRPYWEPRFVCYPASRDLPRITLAALEAEAFLVWPRPRWLRRPAG